MFIEGIILGLIIGIIRNGRISNLFDLNFNGWYLILLGFFIQYTPMILNILKIDFLSYKYFLITGNLLILIVLLINYKISGSLIIMFGGILNLLGYALNNFKMPIIKNAASDKLITGIESGKIITFKLIDNLNTSTHFLGKIIKLPDFYPLLDFISIGDIVMTIGIVFLVSNEMKKVYFQRKSSMLRFPYN
ncbi:MAG: DUF5317 family protein [Bacillota bacterium]